MAAEVPSSHGSLGGDGDGRDREAAREVASDGFDSDEFRAWMRERRGRVPRRRVEEDSDEDERPKGKGAGGAPPEWDGTNMSFQDWLVKVRLWAATTRTKPRHRGPLILQRLGGQPFQALKHWAKDTAWLKSEDNAETLLNTMDSAEFYGEDQEEELLTCLSRLAFHLRREKGEECRTFFRRWDEAHRKVKDEHRVLLPDRYLGFLLVNSLQLTETEIKAMMAFTRGSLTVRDVKEFVRKHEIKLLTKDVGLEKKDKPRSSTTPSTNAIHHVQESEGSEQQDDEIHMVEEALHDLQDADGGEELQGDYGGDNENLLEEHEAAEVLNTMLNQQRKTKTFMQSMKLKKAKELSRGFSNWRRDGKDKGKGRSKSAIEDLKAVTKCAICKKPGHWHRECPEKGSAKDRDKGKELHYIQKVDDGECSEAAFCGMLEREDEKEMMSHGDAERIDVGYNEKLHLTDQLEKGAEMPRLPPGLEQRHDRRAGPHDGLHGDDDPVRAGGQESLHPGEQPLSRDKSAETSDEPTERIFEDHFGQDSTFGAYKDHFWEDDMVVSKPDLEILWGERHGNPVKPGSLDPRGSLDTVINEDFCATIDTGCQRMAIGQETLDRLIPHVPAPLQVMSIPQEHKFKSVHGKSVATRVATIPTGLGHAGSTLRPAIFNDSHSKGAPFLISLPFLLFCRSILHLDPLGQLRVHFRRFKFSAKCHLGPSGTLRLRLDQFDPHKMGMLEAAQKEFQNGGTEFEVYRTAASHSPEGSTTPSHDAEQYGCDEPEQKGSTERGLRPPADASLAPDHQQDPLLDHRDRGAHDRAHQAEEGIRGDESLRTTSIQRFRAEPGGTAARDAFRSCGVMEPRGGSYTGLNDSSWKSRGGHKRELSRGERPAHSEYGGCGAILRSRLAVHPLPDSKAGTELQSPVLAVPSGSEPTVRDVPVVRSPTVVVSQPEVSDDRSGQPQREDVSEQYLLHPSRGVSSPDYHSKGIERIHHPGEVQGLRKDHPERKEIRDDHLEDPPSYTPTSPGEQPPTRSPTTESEYREFREFREFKRWQERRQKK